MATVRYQAGPYSGEIHIASTEDEDDEEILARARHRIRKQMTLPMYYESYEIVSRGEEEDA